MAAGHKMLIRAMKKTSSAIPDKKKKLNIGGF
jgi:hypothetical protein